MLRQVLQLSALALLAACSKKSAEPPYRLELRAPPAIAPGASGALEVRVVAGGGFHLNEDYPVSFKPDPGPIAFAQEKFDLKATGKRTRCAGSDHEDCTLEGQVGFTAPAAGTHRAAGILAFSVCTKEQCLIEKQAVAADVEVR